MIKKNTTPKSPGWSILYSTPTCRSDFPGPLWMKIRVLCPCTSFKATVSAVKGFGAVLKFASAKFRYSDNLVNWTAASPENYGCGGAHSPKKEGMNQPILGKRQLFSFQPFYFCIFLQLPPMIFGGIMDPNGSNQWPLHQFVCLWDAGVHPCL